MMTGVYLEGPGCFLRRQVWLIDTSKACTAFPVQSHCLLHPFRKSPLGKTQCQTCVYSHSNCQTTAQAWTLHSSPLLHPHTLTAWIYSTAFYKSLKSDFCSGPLLTTSSHRQGAPPSLSFYNTHPFCLIVADEMLLDVIGLLCRL